MPVNHRNRKSVSIDKYVNDFHSIYGNYLAPDGEKARSVVDIWLHVVDHASRVGEEVRKLAYDEALDQLAEVAVWVMNFVAKCRQLKPDGVDGIFHFDVKLSDIMWKKYPGVCQYCLSRDAAGTNKNSCQCLVTPKELKERALRLSNTKEDIEAKKKAKKKRINERRRIACDTKRRKPQSIEEWEEMFRKIYQCNIFHSSIETTAFHLLEEVGEVARALTDMYTWEKKSQVKRGKVQEKLEELQEELADTMSWTFTLILKLQEEFQEVEHGATKFKRFARRPQLKISLADAIWRRYGIAKNGRWQLRCWRKKCKHAPCKCTTYFSARNGFTDASRVGTP